MSAPQLQILSLSLTLAADVDAELLVSAAGALPTAGGHALGVTYFAGTSGALTTVTTLGVVNVTAGAAVTAGDAVMATAAGKAIKRTTGNTVVGRAITAAKADGDAFLVHLIAN